MSVVWETKCRYCRSAGTKLYLKGDRCYTRKCPIEKEARRKPPGQHGGTAVRRKMTEFGEQLMEKQKLKRMYQLRERQFARYMDEAFRRRGVTGESLLQLLETRLDNVVYRLGWASSRGQARELVSHRFFTVNDRIVNIPSFQVHPGDVVALHESKRDSKFIQDEAIKRVATTSPPPWLSLNPETFEAKVLHLPSRQEIDTLINEQLIVEFYTR
ncbi:MAG TPA: 30S ribosomal protein S4 [Fimbriimonadales bacterium]|nr:30S ribosomal protein S4 [Fimbriimonadales bacterium]